MFGSSTYTMDQRGQCSSKAKMEVECKVTNRSPSDHTPHLLAWFWVTQRVPRLLAECLFLNYPGYQLIASFLLHFQIIPVLMTPLPKKSPCGCFRKVRPPCLTHRVIHKQDACVSGSSASPGRKQPELQQQLGIIRPTEIASETPLVSDWGEERLSIRLKQIKRATGKGRGERVRWSPSCVSHPNFLYTVQGMHQSKIKGRVTAASLEPHLFSDGRFSQT